MSRALPPVRLFPQETRAGFGSVQFASPCRHLLSWSLWSDADKPIRRDAL
jgi:hypothetical protein